MSNGRPTASDSRARKAHFLCLIADGKDAVQARKLSGIDPDRALRIVTESDYLDVVRAIRDTGGFVAAVVEAPITEQAA